MSTSVNIPIISHSKAKPPPPTSPSTEDSSTQTSSDSAELKVRKPEKLLREIILVEANKSQDIPPPTIDIFKSAASILQHHSEWIDIPALSSVSLSVPVLPIIGLQYYWVQCEDYLGNLTHYVKKEDCATGVVRIIMINSVPVPRRIAISWL